MGDSTNSPGNLCQSSISVKNYFLMFIWHLLWFSLRPLPLDLSLGTTRKSLSPSSPFTYLHTLTRFLPSLLFSRLNSLGSLRLSSYERCSCPVPSSSLWPFAGLSPACLCLSCTGEPRTGHNTTGVASSKLSRGETSPLSTCWQYFA